MKCFKLFIGTPETNEHFLNNKIYLPDHIDRQFDSSEVIEVCFNSKFKGGLFDKNIDLAKVEKIKTIKLRVATYYVDGLAYEGVFIDNQNEISIEDLLNLQFKFRFDFEKKV